MIELLTILTASLPLVELRGAIPLAIENGVHPMKAYLLGVIGNILPIPFVLFFLEELEKKLRIISIFDRFFNWLFTRTRKKAKGKIDKYGTLGLLPFVAIPLPMTGAWTGVAIAYIFGIEFKKALLAISLGVAIAGIVVTAVTLGIFSISLL